MKIVIPGGSGNLGTLLAREFHGEGHEVVVLSRGRSANDSPWRVRAWDATTLGDWATEIDGADVVVNLAGRSINCRHTPQNARNLMRSRVEPTRSRTPSSCALYDQPGASEQGLPHQNGC